MEAVLTGPPFVALAPVTPGVNVVDDAQSPVRTRNSQARVLVRLPLRGRLVEVGLV